MRQFAWFDCLRCAAVFLVMLAHAGELPRMVPAAYASVANAVQLFSWCGVDLFFVLSGFLVSGLLFAEHDKSGGLNIRRFLVRRAFKIIPTFYVLVLATALYDTFFKGGVNIDHLVHDVLFIQNYRAGAWPHAWTLALEVHFYLLLALLLYVLGRTPPKGGEWLRRLPGIIAWVLVACFIARLVNSELRGGFNMHREFQPTHLHLDVLAAGVLLRYLYNYHLDDLAPLRTARGFWIVLGVLLVLPSEFLFRPHPAIVTALIPTLNYLGFGILVFQATQVSFPTGFVRGLVLPFDYLGKHSYSIYVWHLPVRDWLVAPFIKEQGALYFACYFFGTLAVGTLFSVMLEMPVLHVRNRLFPSSTDVRIPAGSEPLPETAVA